MKPTNAPPMTDLQKRVLAEVRKAGTQGVQMNTISDTGISRMSVYHALTRLMLLGIVHSQTAHRFCRLFFCATVSEEAAAERIRQVKEQAAIRSKQLKAERNRRKERIRRKAEKLLRIREMTRGEMQANNVLAAKIKRNHPAGQPTPEKPAPAIVWPEHVQVQRIPRSPGRYEVLATPGPFSSKKPGQYVFEAQSCAARAAA